MRISLRALSTGLLLTAVLALRTHAKNGASLAWTRMGQAGAGFALGVAGLYLGAAAGKGFDPCDEKEEDESFVDFCNSAGSTLGAVGGYLIGTTAGVYGSGRFLGGEGSPWMTAGGAALGLAAGGLLSSQIEDSPALQVMSLVAFSQGMALFGYHWSDRVRVAATLDRVPRKSQAGNAIKPSLILRPQVEVILVRL